MRGSSQEGLAPSTTGGQPDEQPIEIGDLPLEGPETIFVPVPLTAELAIELKEYAAVTRMSMPRAARQFLEIGMRASQAFVPPSRGSRITDVEPCPACGGDILRADFVDPSRCHVPLQRSAERRVD